MVKKSLSALRETGWKLPVSIAGAAFLLALAGSSGGAWWAVLAFAGWLAGFYFSESRERHAIGAAFWIASLLALWGSLLADAADAHFLVRAGIVVGFAAALAVCEGFFRFFFRDRAEAYGILNIAVIFSLFLVFFLSPLSWSSLIATGIAAGVLLREFFLITGAAWRGRVILGSAVLSCAALETAFLVRLMPLDAVPMAAFLTLLTLLLRDALRAHFEGRFGLAFALRGTVLFLFLSALIFGVSLTGFSW